MSKNTTPKQPPAMLTKEQILNADDLPTKVVNVPEWGGPVTVKRMDGAEHESWQESLSDDDGDMITEGATARLVARCVMGPDGKRMFSDNEADKLHKKAGSALTRIYIVAASLNSLRKSDVDEIAKN